MVMFGIEAIPCAVIVGLDFDLCFGSKLGGR